MFYIKNFDISVVRFEETVNNKEWNTVTLYFTAPKEWTCDKYPESVGTTISVEVHSPITAGYFPECMISPVRKKGEREEEEIYEDYDWTELELISEEIIQLLSMAIMR